MIERVKEKIADGNILELLTKYLKQNIVEECKEWTPSQGTPQGAVISPLLANLYLHPLDKLMKENKFRMVRYADDFVILCASQEEAHKLLKDKGMGTRKWAHPSSRKDKSRELCK